MPTDLIHRIGIAAPVEMIYRHHHRGRHPRFMDDRCEAGRARPKNSTMKILCVAILFLAVNGGVVSAADIDVYDDFESPELSKLWSTDRFERGAVTMQTNIVRAGHGANDIRLHRHRA